MYKTLINRVRRKLYFCKRVNSSINVFLSRVLEFTSTKKN